MHSTHYTVYCTPCTAYCVLCTVYSCDSFLCVAQLTVQLTYTVFPVQIFISSSLLTVVLQEIHFLGSYAASSGNLLPMFRDDLSALSTRVKMGPKGCPETSVTNYHFTLRSNPEERGSHLLRGGSLKSHKMLQVLT